MRAQPHRAARHLLRQPQQIGLEGIEIDQQSRGIDLIEAHADLGGRWRGHGVVLSRCRALASFATEPRNCNPDRLRLCSICRYRSLPSCRLTGLAVAPRPSLLPRGAALRKRDALRMEICVVGGFASPGSLCKKRTRRTRPMIAESGCGWEAL